MPKHSVVHGDFTVEKNIKFPVSEVYKMFADQKSKELWFKGPSDAKTEHTMDFRIGGSEFNEGKFHDGVTHTFKGTYYDIVPNERIIYCYEMYLDGNRISVSVATIEFVPEGGGTKVTLQESGVFLDEYDKPETREYGSNLLLGSIEEALKKKGI